jgi:Zn-dependent protease with chaperone function
MPLLPGFAWPLSAGGFFIGLVWLILYSFYLPIVFVLPYNYFVRKAESRSDAG